MTSRKLPDRPNLGQLKKQAKTLLHSAHAGDPAAQERFQILPAFAAQPPTTEGAGAPALHDAQSVIAREHGFPSWRALREHVEELGFTFAAATEEFLRCATGNAAERAERILKLHPGIAGANLHAELVLGDAARVLARLETDPALATSPGGPQRWAPLLYVCHTCLPRGHPSRGDGLVEIARRLLELGADPNAEYHWQWHRELPRTVLWGALCGTAHQPLAELLLARGANPDDGVSLHINAGGGNLPVLELLHRHGVNPDGPPGGLPPLVYILGWATNPRGVHWLLEHGANPNLPWSETGEYPLHVAARRWDPAMTAKLVEHGADLTQRNAAGATPHTVAALQGNAAVATWLREHGAADELSSLQRFVAACARGDADAAASARQTEPRLMGQLQPEHHALMQRPAEHGDAATLEVMLENGFDPHTADKDGVTPLHRAAMGGHPEAARALLRHGADVNALDGMFRATPLVWAVEGRRGQTEGEDRHVRVARVLLDAGSSHDWAAPDGAPNIEGTLERLHDLIRAAQALDV